MDLLPPAPGSDLPGAPPALHRALTPRDGRESNATTPEPAPNAGSPERDTQSTRGTGDPATSGRPRRTDDVGGRSPLHSYLPALGLLCAAAAVWVGTRRRPATPSQ